MVLMVVLCDDDGISIGFVLQNASAALPAY